jgi:hypothetical protein
MSNISNEELFLWREGCELRRRDGFPDEIRERLIDVLEEAQTKLNALYDAGDKLCGEAQQLTVTVPRKQLEQCEKVEAAVAAFRGVCMGHIKAKV